MSDDKRATWAMYEHLREDHGATARDLLGMKTLDELRAHHTAVAPGCKQ